MGIEGIKITKQEKEYFDYLNKLRESGITNMFGASPYLVREFRIDKDDAIQILSKWMQLFNEDGYEHLL